MLGCKLSSMAHAARCAFALQRKEIFGFCASIKWSDEKMGLNSFVIRFFIANFALQNVSIFFFG